MIDPFDRLRQPVEPLAPPSGTFDVLLARARRRRAARAAALVALATVIIAGLGGLALTAGRPASSGRLEIPAGGGTPSPAVRSTPTPTSPAPSAVPFAATPSASAPAASLPHGPVPPGFQPYSVTSVGGGVSYLLGDAPCRLAPCTSVVRSTDGGRSWLGVPAPKAPLAPWQRFDNPITTVRDLRFASVRDGWAYGGALYATHDAGGHWTPVEVGGSVLDLATDGSTTYAVVATCDPQGFNCSGARLRSTRADRDDWRDVTGVEGGASEGRVSLGGGVGVATLAAPGADDRLFARTGLAWKPVGSLTCRLTGVTTSASSPRLFAFCGNGAAGSVYLTSYVSDDNGLSWRRQSGAALQLPSGMLMTFAAPTADVVLGASTTPDRGGRLARSVDSGRHWTDVVVPNLPYGWRYVGARSAYSIVALPGKPDGSVWTSQDAGASWTAYRFR